MNQQATPHYAAIQAENKRLAQRVKQLEDKLKQIQKMVKRVMDLAIKIYGEASKRQSRGNMPRPAWSYLKGLMAASKTLAEKLAEIYYT